MQLQIHLQQTIYTSRTRVHCLMYLYNSIFFGNMSNIIWKKYVHCLRLHILKTNNIFRINYIITSFFGGVKHNWKNKKIIKFYYVRLFSSKKCYIVLCIENENKRSVLPPLTLWCLHIVPPQLLVVRLI